MTIWFGTLASEPKDTAASPGADAPKPAAAPEKSDIEKAGGENGRTVAEVYAQRTELNGKVVTVRGRVTKYNSGILGRNWLHLQDGSGSAGDKTNDLTVTTEGQEAPVEVGSVVEITGTLALDQDFGSGYSYPVLVEKATINR